MRKTHPFFAESFIMFRDTLSPPCILHPVPRKASYAWINNYPIFYFSGSDYLSASALHTSYNYTLNKKSLQERVYKHYWKRSHKYLRDIKGFMADVSKLDQVLLCYESH